MSIRKIPGLSIRIQNKGTFPFNADIGFSDLAKDERLKPTHMFRIGCLTKPIIAHAILYLSSQNQIDLDEPITTYISKLKERFEFQAITIAHLLSHTSGLARGAYHTQAEDELDTLEKIATSQLLFDPGTDFKYSNWGFLLLGLIIENTTGDTTENFISQTVFSPYAMTNSCFSGNESTLKGKLACGYWQGWYFGCADLTSPSLACPHAHLPNASAGMISTTDDYLRWLVGLTAKINSTTTDITDKMLLARHLITSKYSVCFGWFVELIDGLPFYFFSGSNSGFSGFIFMIPDMSLSGIAFCNQGSCTSELRDILYQVCLEEVCKDPLPHFGRHFPEFNVLAVTRKSSVQFKATAGNIPTFTSQNNQFTLYPHSAKAYYLLDGDCPSKILRIRNIGKEDAILTLGNETFYENISRLRKEPIEPEPFKILAGFYHHEAFGKVEIIFRDCHLYLNYGVMYETLLQHTTGIEFKQRPGAFCYEKVEFIKNTNSNEVVSFIMSEMVFVRQSQQTIEKLKSRTNERIQ